jgi:hypothetical protein
METEVNVSYRMEHFLLPEPQKWELNTMYLGFCSWSLISFWIRSCQMLKSFPKFWQTWQLSYSGLMTLGHGCWNVFHHLFFTNHMVTTYMFASDTSVRPITASPLTHFLMWELYRKSQTTPKVIKPEDGNCKVCWNGRLLIFYMA